MTAFSEALKKAGIRPGSVAGKDKKKAEAFTLEMKLYEMQNHITAMNRIYQKYLSAEGDDKFDFMDSLANRFGYMVIAFQDIMTTVSCISGRIKRNEELSIRRSISEFQNFFPEECRGEMDGAVSSFSDRNEIVHVYENYEGNMETVLANVSNYLNSYGEIRKILWKYCEDSGILGR